MNRDAPWVERPGAPRRLRAAVRRLLLLTDDFMALVRSLKYRIPWSLRRYDARASTWRVSPAGGPELRLWILAHFPPERRRLIGLELDDLAGPRSRSVFLGAGAPCAGGRRRHGRQGHHLRARKRHTTKDPEGKRDDRQHPHHRLGDDLG